MSELVLGSAQFGAGYGITNATGRLSDAVVTEILGLAAQAGIALVDTAADYGDAQERLGVLNPAEGARYITKFSLPDDPREAPSAHALFGASQESLGVPTLHGVLFHRLSDFDDVRCGQTVDLLRDARASGRIGRAGASVYDVESLERALEAFPDLDLVQIPGNVADRRLLDHPLLAQLHGDGVEIHVRSALLQGLLLLEPEQLSGFFAPLRPVVEDLRSLAAAAHTSVLAVVLGFLAAHPLADGVLVGATSADELGQLVDAWTAGPSATLPAWRLPDEVLDPRRWPIGEVVR
ncbi:hypothetical protein ASE14_05330 [Agromyces sp. Root81]|uniref:aldo/keto reductase n=1 Tax=Agromyces sp. Root81 TaxID=1736601 RepID=UPI0006FDC50C|nr:aldo/keto reductase [Agromyces sp. Root81]KRC60444.1 hypothetical protein ASE14_05330 [Agromyces sp. Root81]